MSSSTYYRVVCDRHTPPVLLADITCDPDQEASQRHEQELRRWDRHATGEETILNSAGYPYPRDFRPDLYRHSSRKITVYPHEHMFVPELVDPSSQDPVDAILRGEPLPPPGHEDSCECWATRWVTPSMPTDAKSGSPARYVHR